MNLIAPISEVSPCGIACPKCKGHGGRVTDSRPTEDGSFIRRRRRCHGCGHRFTTHEIVAPEYSHEINPRAIAEKIARAEKSLMWLGSLLIEVKRELDGGKP